MTLTFQIIKINPIEPNEKQHLRDVVMNSNEVSGADTVGEVKEKLASKLNLNVEGFKLYFSGSQMLENTLFYADNYMLLPATIQVYTF